MIDSLPNWHLYFYQKETIGNKPQMDNVKIINKYTCDPRKLVPVSLARKREFLLRHLLLRVEDTNIIRYHACWKTLVDTQLLGYFEQTSSEDSVFIDSFCGQWIIYARYQGATVFFFRWPWTYDVLGWY